jgi:hypothetical protein
MVMCVDQVFGETCKVVPVIHPEKPIAKSIDWANTHLWPDTNIDVPSMATGEITSAADLQQCIENQLTNSHVAYIHGNMAPDWTQVHSYGWLLAPPDNHYGRLAIEKAKSLCSGTYHLIHTRFDWKEPDENIVSRYIAEIKRLIPEDMPTILVTDSPTLKKEFQNVFDLKQSPTKALHTNNIETDEDIVDFWTDLVLICNAKRITTLFTVGGGFSNTPATVLGIPIQSHYMSRQP